MNATTLGRIGVLGAATGMRSFSGPAAVALSAGGPLAKVLPVMALAEVVADKTSMVGNRTDPAPLAGRVLMGALVGGYIARRDGSSVVAGSLVGALTAFAAAHLAFRLRTRLPGNATALGLAEDAAVAGLCLMAGRR